MPQIKSDKEYQKEYDAQTLAEAEKIKADKSRFSGAKQAAKKMATEQTKHIKALSKVAGTRVPMARTTRTKKK